MEQKYCSLRGSIFSLFVPSHKIPNGILCDGTNKECSLMYRSVYGMIGSLKLFPLYSYKKFCFALLCAAKQSKIFYTRTIGKRTFLFV